MYRTQRRKSGRVLPYDIASSTTSSGVLKSRKSSQFISPIVNYDLSASAIKNKRTSLPSDLESLDNQSVLTSVNSNLDDTLTTIEDNKTIGQNNSERNLYHNQQVNHNLNKFRSNENDHNPQNAFNLPIKKQSTSSCPLVVDKTLVSQQKVHNNVSQSSHHQTSFLRKEDTIDQENDDDLFDSEYDKLLNTSSLEDKLNGQLNRSPANLSADEQSDVNEYEGDRDDLFDSDAINNDDCDSLQLDDIESNYRASKENTLSNFDPILLANDKDMIASLEADEVEDDNLDIELDSTLIFRKENPIMSQYIVEPILDIPPDDDGFKTATGLPIRIKMTASEQRANAKRLGLL